jgi:SAM-dependent methyltransferase
VPGPSERSHTNRDRAESFGQVAEQYDRYRPSYPAALIDDLLAPAPAAVLDIGSGTGKAAVLLAARGADVQCVEIDPAMAAVARRHGLDVEVGAFETWDARDRTFDLITCGQAWHWIEPEAGTAKVGRLLRPGGRAALFWNYDELDERTQAALDEVYAREAPELSWSVVVGRDRKVDRPYADELQGSGLFATVDTRTYRWDHTYPAAQWLSLVQTHSDHLAIDPERRATLVAALREAIDSIGGVINSHYTTYAMFARVAG